MTLQKPSEKVIMDTSLILCCIEDSLDPNKILLDYLDAPLEILIPMTVVKEMEELSGNKGRRGRLARTGLQLIKRKLSIREVKILEEVVSSDVDEDVILLSQLYNAYLATADKELAEKARARKARVLVYRKAKKQLFRVS